MPHMIKSTVEFSDGTETVVNYNENGNAVEIEETVAEAVLAKEPEVETPAMEESPEEIVEPVEEIAIVD